MDELERLIAQKKEIEQRIREVKNRETIVGRTKIGVERYTTGKPDRHFIAVEVENRDETRIGRSDRPRWRAIINGTSRKSVVAGIPDIIRDLAKLYDQEVGAK